MYAAATDEMPAECRTFALFTGLSNFWRVQARDVTFRGVCRLLTTAFLRAGVMCLTRQKLGL